MAHAFKKLPEHVAIIMDGNGRWAKEKSLPRIRGHLRGMRVIKNIVKECSDLGIKFLTLYSFSEENWRRPPSEVNFLMRLLRVYLIKELQEFHENNVKILSIGNIEKIPAEPLSVLKNAMEFTKNNTGLNLVFALSYSGRDEIISAVHKIASDHKNSNLDLKTISVENFNNYLFTSFMPDPDLLIRTSGEMRISNFLLWQLAYTEMYITDIYWPDFEIPEFHKALKAYEDRDRRFGKIAGV